MTQAATFGRRGPAVSAPSPRAFAPASSPAPAWPTEAAPAPATSFAGRAFSEPDEELESWKSERRDRIWSMFGYWRWIGIAAGAGAFALAVSRHDPGHLAGPLMGISLLSWFRGYMRYRRIMRAVSEIL